MCNLCLSSFKIDTGLLRTNEVCSVCIVSILSLPVLVDKVVIKYTYYNVSIQCSFSLVHKVQL